MKNSKSLVLILTLICLCLATVTLLTACTPSNSGISFNTLTLKNNKATVKVSNATTEFSFLEEITVNGKADYTVCLDLRGNKVVESKILTLEEGDNKVFIMETINGKPGNTYEVTVRRRVMYEVTFNTNGGKEVAPQMVEEDGFMTAVETSKLGCDFKGWSHDVTSPITEDTVVTAKFTPKAEMNAFSFVATDTTCVINGVKDSSITQVVIPDYVTAIAERAFFNCKKMTTVTMGDKVKTIGANAFYGCDTLKSIKLSNALTTIEEKTFYDCISLSDVTIPANVTTIGKQAFYNCNALKSINIPEGVTTIGEGAFGVCWSLMSITIPNTVTSIGKEAFLDCERLVEVVSRSSAITVVAGSTSNGHIGANAIDVYNVGNVFETKFSENNGYLVYSARDGKILMDYCGTAVDLTLPTDIVNIYNRVFYQRDDLNSVVMGDNVKIISSNAFAYCANMKSITISKNLKVIGERAFYGCLALQNLALPEGLTTISAHAFHNCSSLVEVVIPDTVTFLGESAFESCSQLTVVTISNAISQIGFRAFYRCTSLTTLILGKGVTYIADYAFEGCSKLEKMLYRGTSSDWRNVNLDYELNMPLLNLKRYYYSETRPGLNNNGTGYNGNYWRYDENGNPVIWVL